MDASMTMRGAQTVASVRAVQQGAVDQFHVARAHVLEMHVGPCGLSRTDLKGLLPFQHDPAQLRDLHAPGVAGPSSRSVDVGRTDDGRLDAIRIFRAGGQHDLVNDPVWRGIRHGRHVANALPIIPYPVRDLTVSFLLEVFPSRPPAHRRRGSDMRSNSG